MPPAPADGEAHVWRIDLDRLSDSSDALETLHALLAPDERDRADRFALPHLRRRYVAGRGILRMILGGYLGQAPEALRFVYGPQGKPELEDRAERAGGVDGVDGFDPADRAAGTDGIGPSDHAGGTSAAALRFNLAHSEHLALCAIASGQAVGVDIERVRPLDTLTHLAEHVFAPAERAALAALPVEQRSQGFLSAWTRKEAIVKATGCGLAQDLTAIEVTLAPTEPARILRMAGDADAQVRWTLLALQPAPGWVAAVALEGRLERLTLLDGSGPLLKAE